MCIYIYIYNDSELCHSYIHTYTIVQATTTLLTAATTSLLLGAPPAVIIINIIIIIISSSSSTIRFIGIISIIIEGQPFQGVGCCAGSVASVGHAAARGVKAVPAEGGDPQRLPRIRPRVGRRRAVRAERRLLLRQQVGAALLGQALRGLRAGPAPSRRALLHRGQHTNDVIVSIIIIISSSSSSSSNINIDIISTTIYIYIYTHMSNQYNTIILR